MHPPTEFEPRPGITVTVRGIKGHPIKIKEVNSGTVQIRHAAEHRTNIAITDLRRGLRLLHLISDEARKDRMKRVYAPVCPAENAEEENDESEVLNEGLAEFAEVDSVTKLYTQLQYTIEASIFQYTQRNHLDLLLETKCVNKVS